MIQYALISGIQHTNPDVIWIFLLTHGYANGTVYTDNTDHLDNNMSDEERKKLQVSQLESYNVSEIWDALKLLNLDCLFVLLLGVSEKQIFIINYYLRSCLRIRVIIKIDCSSYYNYDHTQKDKLQLSETQRLKWLIFLTQEISQTPP